MQKSASVRGGIVVLVTLMVGTIAALYAARAYAAELAGSVRVVATARVNALDKTILVNRRGLSLYSLSVERHGRFICTNPTCLSFWTPLTIKKGTKPSGLAGLGTVKRPNGATQVTYRGAPLYTFYLDRKRGDIGGNGFKDVGVWHPVAAMPAA